MALNTYLDQTEMRAGWLDCQSSGIFNREIIRSIQAINHENIVSVGGQPSIIIR